MVCIQRMHCPHMYSNYVYYIRGPHPLGLKMYYYKSNVTLTSSHTMPKSVYTKKL